MCDPSRDLVALGGEPGDVRRERCDDAHPVRGGLQGDVGLREIGPALADHVGEGGLRSAAVERPHDGVERLAPDPVPAAGVAHDVTPAVDPRDRVPADGEGDDAGARGDDRAARVAERAEERRGGVVREHRLADAGVAQELEQRARIGIPVRQAGDPCGEDVGRQPRTGDGGANDVGELRQQRLVRADAVEDEVVGVLRRAAPAPSCRSGPHRSRARSPPCLARPLRRHVISFAGRASDELARGRRPAPATDTRRRPRGR